MMMSLKMIESRAGFFSAHKKHECPLFFLQKFPLRIALVENAFLAQVLVRQGAR